MNAILDFFFRSQPTGSRLGQLSALDWKKTLRTVAVIALAGALTSLADYTAKNLAGWDFGVYRPFVVPLITGLIELARRWVTTHQI